MVQVRGGWCCWWCARQLTGVFAYCCVSWNAKLRKAWFLKKNFLLAACLWHCYMNTPITRFRHMPPKLIHVIHFATFWLWTARWNKQRRQNNSWNHSEKNKLLCSEKLQENTAAKRCQEQEWLPDGDFATSRHAKKACYQENAETQRCRWCESKLGISQRFRWDMVRLLSFSRMILLLPVEFWGFCQTVLGLTVIVN